MRDDYAWEARALTDAYNTAVGWALQYGIKVYRPGGNTKSLGELEDEIFAHESVHGLAAAPRKQAEKIAAQMRMRQAVRYR